MRLDYNLWEVWMFENQTEEKEEEEEGVIFQRDNKEYWCGLRKQKPFVIDQFQFARAKNNLKLFICMLCNGASFVEHLYL